MNIDIGTRTFAVNNDRSVARNHQGLLAVFSQLLLVVFLILQYKLCKVKKLWTGVKGVPQLSTHDARTIRYPDPSVKSNDTVKVDIATGNITDYIKFESGEFDTCDIYVTINLFFSRRDSGWVSWWFIVIVPSLLTSPDPTPPPPKKKNENFTTTNKESWSSPNKKN